MSIITPVAEYDADEQEFKPLSAEEAQLVLSSSQPAISSWQIVVWQVMVGVLVALIAYAITGHSAAGLSAGYGALAVVVPAIFFIRGLARQRRIANAGSALLGFFVWEMVKIVLTVAMLFAAPKLIVQLNWLALLAGFVVTMKVYWVAMWLHSVRKDSFKKK
jgi:ATP synthase protein I